MKLIRPAIGLFIFLGLFLAFKQAYAETTGVVNPTPSNLNSTNKAATTEEQRLQDAKKKALEEVARRVVSLNSVIGKVNEARRLTDAQKSSLTTSAQAQITSLTNLQKAIAAATDAATLKIERQSIAKEHRVYLLFIPKTQITAAADRVLNTTETIDNLIVKIQSRIDLQKAAGKDTTALQSLLDSLKTSATNAKLKAQEAINTVSGLSPDGGDPTLAASNKSALVSAHGAIKTAIADLQSIRVSLGTFRKNNNNLQLAK